MDTKYLSNSATRRVSLAAAVVMGLALGACTTMGTAQTEQFAPVRAGWGFGANDRESGFDATTTNHSGKVAANLEGPGSQRMRCRFDLNEPLSGMAGGGRGKCQVAGGATVDATFPRA
jgi:hypothetical protein